MFGYSRKQRLDGGFDFFDKGGKKIYVDDYVKATGANKNQLINDMAKAGDKVSQKAMSRSPLLAKPTPQFAQTPRSTPQPTQAPKPMPQFAQTPKSIPLSQQKAPSVSIVPGANSRVLPTAQPKDAFGRSVIDFGKSIISGIQQAGGSIADKALMGVTAIDDTVAAINGASAEDRAKIYNKYNRSRDFIKNSKTVTGDSFNPDKDFEFTGDAGRDAANLTGRSLQTGLDATMFVNPGRLVAGKALAAPTLKETGKFIARDAGFFGTGQGLATGAQVYGETGDLGEAAKQGLVAGGTSALAQGAMDTGGAVLGTAKTGQAAELIKSADKQILTAMTKKAPQVAKFDIEYSSLAQQLDTLPKGSPEYSALLNQMTENRAQRLGTMRNVQRRFAEGGFIAGPGARGFNAAQDSGRVFDGVDGRPRFEVDDSGAKLNNEQFSWGLKLDGKPRKVGDILEHDKMFEQYPELKDINVRYEPNDLPGHDAHFDSTTNSIVVTKSRADKSHLSDIIHELQHSIQEKEGFAGGGAPNYRNYKLENASIKRGLQDVNTTLSGKNLTPEQTQRLRKRRDNLIKQLEQTQDQYGNVYTKQKDIAEYRNLAGEAEARAVQSRMNMPMSERYVKGKDASEYAMSHRPNEDGPQAHAMDNGEWFGKDYYDKPEWYGANLRDAADKESFEALKKIRGNPNAEVTIYRAGPKNEFNKGDWVSLSKKYAEQEALTEGVPVHSIKVKASDVRNAGDSINEFGYYPKNNLRSTFYDSLDVPKEDLIIRNGDGKAMSIEKPKKETYRAQPRELKKAIDAHIEAENPNLSYMLSAESVFPDGIPRVRPEDVMKVAGLSAREMGIPPRYVSKNAEPLDKIAVDYELAARGNNAGELKMTEDDILGLILDAHEMKRGQSSVAKQIVDMRNDPAVIAKAKAQLDSERSFYEGEQLHEPSKRDLADYARDKKKEDLQIAADNAAKKKAVLAKIKEEKTKDNPVLPEYETKRVSLLDKAFRSTRSIIERQGKSGKELADKLSEQRDSKELFIRDIEKRLPTVTKLKDKEFENFIDATQGNAKPLNANVERAITEWQSTHPQIRERGQEAGLNIGDLGETYYPHFIDYDKIYKDKNTYNAAINHLVTTGQAATPEKAIELLGHARDVSRNREFGNLEASRLIDLPFYDRSKATLASYLNGSADRITKAEIFGKEDEHALKLIKQIALEGGDAEAAKNSFDVAVGAKKYNPTASKISGGIRQYVTTTRLGLGALTNVSQNVNTGIVTGHMRTLGSMFKQLDPKQRQWAADTGVISDAIIQDLRRGYGAETFGNKKVGKVVNAITAPGFATVEKFNRRVAAISGRDYALRLAQKGDPKSIKVLRDLGVTGDIGGTLTKYQQIQAAREIVKKTQFKVDPQDLPGWADSPGGKLVAQFRTFSYNQAKFFSNEILKPAAKGNLMPLSRLLASLPLGYALYETRRLIDGRPEEEDKSKVALSSFQKVGGAGLAMDIYLGMNPLNSKYLPSDRRVSMAVGTFGGPAAGIAADAIGSASDAIQRKKTPEDQSRLDGKVAVAKDGDTYTDLSSISRFGLRQIPIVGTATANRVLPYKKQTEADSGKGTVANSNIPDTKLDKETSSYQFLNSIPKMKDNEKKAWRTKKIDSSSQGMIDALNKSLPEGLPKFEGDTATNAVAELYANYQKNKVDKGWSELQAKREGMKLVADAYKTQLSNNEKFISTMADKDILAAAQNGEISKAEMDNLIRVDDILVKLGITQTIGKKIRAALGYSGAYSGGKVAKGRAKGGRKGSGFTEADIAKITGQEKLETSTASSLLNLLGSTTVKKVKSQTPKSEKVALKKITVKG